jgi:hypothetical protein
MVVNTSLSKKRLIVLLPGSLAGSLDLAHKVFWMADRDGCDVLYLVLVDDEEEFLPVSYSMINMKAITSSNSLTVNAVLVKAGDWLKKLNELYRPGDRIACQAEQSVKNGFLRTLPIGDYLHDTLGITPLEISGFYRPEQVQYRIWLRSLVTWLGFLVILIGFTLLEIQIDRQLHSAAATLTLIFLVTVEIGILWGWESLTNR